MAGPSPWVQRWSHLLAPGATVLDVACGPGRHVRWFAGRGHPVTAVDRAAASLQALEDLVVAGRARTVLADIENGPWPLQDGDHPRRFGGVVVTNYLWRPLMPVLLESLAVGGVLLYETFAHGQAGIGRPSRPEFLLQPGELLDHCRSLHVVAFEDGFCAAPPRHVQRIVAVRAPARPAGGSTEPVPVPRYRLSGE